MQFEIQQQSPISQISFILNLREEHNVKWIIIVGELQDVQALQHFKKTHHTTCEPAAVRRMTVGKQAITVVSSLHEFQTADFIIDKATPLQGVQVVLLYICCSLWMRWGWMSETDYIKIRESLFWRSISFMFWTEGGQMRVTLFPLWSDQWLHRQTPWRLATIFLVGPSNQFLQTSQYDSMQIKYLTCISIL